MIRPILLLCLSVLCPFTGRSQDADVERATRQFREFLLVAPGRAPSNLEARSHNSGNPDLPAALRFAREIRPDGSWAAIDYSDTARSRWRPFEHVLRMVSMAVMLQRDGLSTANRDDLLQACKLAGSYWRERDFKCPNWWYNEIGAPQSFGEYALLMGKDLPAEDFKFITETILPRSGIRMTGQNKVWLAGNVLMRALLLKDAKLAEKAAGTIWSEVAVVAEEGMQPDWSFHQHGPQQQFGNYGLGFAVEIARWVTILRDTSFALPPEKLSDFRNYLLEGMNWVCWRGSMDISSCARQITPRSPRAKASSIKRVFENMRLADPAAASSYSAFVSRNERGATNDLVGSRYFWRSDYGVHRQPEFFATLKMHSARVIGVETVNTENLAGRYLADGALFLYAAGGEYEEIFPVLDWRHIPGTTLEWKSETPRTGLAADRQKTRWVGGVSDSVSSAAVMDYDRDGVRAHKSWFFKGDIVVCLGSGITSQGENAIHTTINQALLRGRVVASAQGQAAEEVGKGQSELNAATRVEHNGFVYGFFKPTDVVLAQQPRTGNWRTVFVNPSTPKEDVTLDVFSLWIDHGAKPTDASYAYWATLAGANGAPPELMSNTTALQALRWADGQVQAAFWNAGTLSVAPGRDLTVSDPCLLQLEHAAKSSRLSVSDPSQSLKTLTVKLGGVEKTLTLPDGLKAGSTLMVEWE